MLFSFGTGACWDFRSSRRPQSTKLIDHWRDHPLMPAPGRSDSPTVRRLELILCQLVRRLEMLEEIGLEL